MLVITNKRMKMSRKATEFQKKLWVSYIEVTKIKEQFMKWLIMLIFYFLYWGICYLCTGTDEKNLMGLRSYPINVQKIVREKMNNAPKAKSITNILISNILLFTIVFSIMGLLFKNIYNFNNYLSAFIYFLLLGEGLGLFDL